MRHGLGVLIFPDFQLLDATGPISAFEIAGRCSGAPFPLRMMALDAGAVPSSSGVALQSESATVDGLDTLLVVGGMGDLRAAEDPRIVSFVRDAAQKVRRVGSICSGAYILAAAGLLDGRPATTHWSRTYDFQRRFPKVLLDPDRIYTKHQNVWTSAGVTAGIDLSLAMIGEDFGERIARAVAQQLVVYHRRPAGQSQFSALLDLAGEGGRFAELLDWARARLDADLGVEALADKAAMSPRNFARTFRAATGMTPAKAIERLRLEAARQRVEQRLGTIEEIARATGFNDPERMRRAFVRSFGQPPQALRRAAGVV